MHLQDEAIDSRTATPVTKIVDALSNALSNLVNRYHIADGLIAELSNVNQNISGGLILSTRRFELEALQAGQVSICCPQLKTSSTMRDSNVKTTELHCPRPILRQLRATGPQPLRSYLRT